MLRGPRRPAASRSLSPSSNFNLQFGPPAFSASVPLQNAWKTAGLPINSVVAFSQELQLLATGGKRTIGHRMRACVVFEPGLYLLGGRRVGGLVPSCSGRKKGATAASQRRSAFCSLADLSLACLGSHSPVSLSEPPIARSCPSGLSLPRPPLFWLGRLDFACCHGRTQSRERRRDPCVSSYSGSQASTTRDNKNRAGGSSAQNAPLPCRAGLARPSCGS